MKSDLINKLVDVASHRPGKNVIVGVHDGVWHADELLALAVLRVALPEDLIITVVRSRKAPALAGCDIQVDVGLGEYDHHQNDNAFMPNGIPHAACTKVLWAVEEDIQLRNKLCADLFYAVAAFDNGYPLPSGIPQSKLLWVPSTNPTYEEPWDEETQFQAFLEAGAQVEKIYRRIRAHAMAVINGQSKLEAAPRILGGKVLDMAEYVPPADYLWKNPELLAAIYPSKTSGFTVQVAADPVTRDQRVSLPAAWGGLPQEELRKVSGIPGIRFVHRGLWMSSCDTHDDALKIAATLL